MLSSSQYPIPSYIKDPMYRYKMSQMKLKIEGRGNGIKTNIVNLTEIADDLRVPPLYALKFLGIEHGSQVKMSETGTGVTAILNGSFTEPQLRPTMDKFIEKYVLCQKCKLPEIVIAVENGKVTYSCNGCGGKGQLDNNHKLAKLIVQNPPQSMADIQQNEDGRVIAPEKTKKKADKDGKSKKKDGEKKEKEDNGEKKDKKKKKSTKKKTVLEEEDLEALTKFTERINETKEYNLQSELLWELITFFREKFLSVMEDDTEGGTTADFLYNIIKKCKFTKETSEMNGFLIFNTIFGLNIAKEVKTHSKYLFATFSRAHREKFLRYEVLLSLEYKLLKQYPETDFTKYIPTIMMGFYQADVLDKEWLLKWKAGEHDEILSEHCLWDKELDDQFKEKAADFLKFLEEGGDDSDDSSDDDDSDEDED